METQSASVQSLVLRVLSELGPEGLLILKDQRLEVKVVPEHVHTVWAYFPLYRTRRVAKKLASEPETRVLLVLSAAGFEQDPEERTLEHLRDHLGHVLLYLNDSRAKNNCHNAMKEWRKYAR